MAEEFKPEEPKQKTPLRFWVYGAIALFALVSTLIFMAEFFRGEKSETLSERSKKVEDGRMLRPL